MPFGLLTDEMITTIQPLVAGKSVWDFGAGDMTYALMMHEMGAHVTAIDKEDMPDVRGVRRLQCAFSVLQEARTEPLDIDVAFVSWPVNYSCDLGDLVDSVPVVIYLGLNCSHRGTACGGPGFWASVVGRERLHVIEHVRNNLIVYGPRKNPYDTSWRPLDEEKEALNVWFPGMLEKFDLT